MFKTTNNSMCQTLSVEQKNGQSELFLKY